VGGAGECSTRIWVLSRQASAGVGASDETPEGEVDHGSGGVKRGEQGKQRRHVLVVGGSLQNPAHFHTFVLRANLRRS
jgi:hypothetical protein